MLKQLAVACVALAFATPAAAQSIIEKAKQREAQQQQQQKKAGAGQPAGTGATRNPITKKVGERCNRNADSRKLNGDARKRYMDQCMQGKG